MTSKKGTVSDATIAFILTVIIVSLGYFIYHIEFVEEPTLQYEYHVSEYYIEAKRCVYGDVCHIVDDVEVAQVYLKVGFFHSVNRFVILETPQGRIKTDLENVIVQARGDTHE